jgi:hypothetical protein
MKLEKFNFSAKTITVPTPTAKTVTGTKAISWGGDNCYPYDLVGLYETCGVHAGVINGKVNFITAKGLEYNGTDIDRWNTLKNNFESDYSLNEVLEAAALDLELFNGFAIKGTWRVKGLDAILEPIDIENLRLSEDKDEDGNDIWLYKNNWSAQNERDIEILLPFNPEKRTGSFVVVFMNKPKTSKRSRKATQDSPYPKPTYTAGIKSILTDIEIKNFDLSEIANGFSNGTLILMPGEPEPGEESKLQNELRSEGTGSDNAGGVVVKYYEPGDEKSQVQVIPLTGNDLAERYTNKNKSVTDAILQAHSVVSGLLFGVKEAGQLGGTSELEQAYEIMRANYFQKRQRMLGEAFTFLLSKCSGLVGSVTPAPVPLPKPQQTEKTE